MRVEARSDWLQLETIPFWIGLMVSVIGMFLSWALIHLLRDSKSLTQIDFNTIEPRLVRDFDAVQVTAGTVSVLASLLLLVGDKQGIPALSVALGGCLVVVEVCLFVVVPSFRYEKWRKGPITVGAGALIVFNMAGILFERFH